MVLPILVSFAIFFRRIRELESDLNAVANAQGKVIFQVDLTEVVFVNLLEHLWHLVDNRVQFHIHTERHEAPDVDLGLDINVGFFV